MKVALKEPEPCCSKSVDIVSGLNEIFPNSSKELHKEVANRAENITDAAELMLTLVERNKPIFPDEELKRKMEGKQKKRLFIDEEYILDNCLS